MNEPQSHEGKKVEIRTTFTPQAVIALFSAIVHADEISVEIEKPKRDEHAIMHDVAAFRSALNNIDIQEGLRALDLDGFLPIRRDGVRYVGKP